MQRSNVMYDLFLSEFKRFRYYALAASAALFGFLIYFDGAKPIMANVVEHVIGYVGFAILLSLALSITQMVLHKRKGHWAFLVHRPLPEKSIFFAIAGAGAALVLITVATPVLLVLIMNDLKSVDLVESRHYLFIVHVSLVALFCYFLGLFTVLNPSWSAFLTIGLLFFVMVSDPISASSNLAIDAVCVILVAYLAMRSFKVNLSLHFERKRDIFLTTMASNITIIALLYVSQMLFYHLPLFVIGEHPDSYKKEQLAGYYAQLWQLDNEELIELVVDEQLYPEKETLKQQMELAPRYFVRAQYRALPERGQIFHQDKSYALEDRQNSTRWLFSHSEMMFIGKHLRTGETQGYIGPNGFYNADVNLQTITSVDRFTAIPVVERDHIIRTHNTLYTVDFEKQYIEVKHKLNDGEYYFDNMQTAANVPSVAYVTNLAVYIFDKADFNLANAYSEPDMVIEHYRMPSNLHFIHVYELVEGYLLSYHSSDYFGFDKPGIGLVYAKHDGEHIKLGETEFSRGYRPLPNLISHQSYWMSPIAFTLGFKTLESLSKSELSPDTVTFGQRLSFEYPSSVYIMALLTWFVCAVLTFILGKKQRHSVTKLIFWQGIIAVFSLGGFVSFLLMHRWRELVRKPKAENTSTQSVSIKAASSTS